MILKYKDIIINEIIKKILAILIISSTLYTFRQSLYYVVEREYILKISLICYLIINVLFYNTKVLIWSSIIIGIIANIWQEMIQNTNEWNMIINWISTFEYQIYTSINNNKGIELQFQYIIITAVAVILSFITYYIWNKKNYYTLYVIIISTFLLVMLKISPEVKLDTNNILFIIFLLIICYFYTFINNNKGIKAKKAVIFFIATIFFSSCTLLSVVAFYKFYPKPIESLQERNKKKSDNTKKKEILKKKNASNVKHTINMNALNRTPQYTGKEICIVKSKKNIYLRGVTFDVFKNNTWYNNAISDKEYNLKHSTLNIKNYYKNSNVFENIIGINLLLGKTPNEINFNNNNWMDDTLINKYFYMNSIKVNIKNFISKSLLIPLNTFNVGFSKDSINKKDKMGWTQYENLFKKEEYSKGTSYTVDTLIPNYNSEELKNLLRKSSRGFYKSKNFIYKDILIRKSQKIYAKNSSYIQVPHWKEINEIKDLTKKIVKEETNDYDKAKTVEQYLKNNYKYNLNIKLDDNSKNAIYDFLFKTKEGFCQNYASSMAIMLRTIGLPTRYVTGYVVKDTVFYQKGFVNDIIKEKTYEVKDNHAHAWVEVYFEGFGWVPFEPTGGYGASEVSKPLKEKQTLPDKSTQINIKNNEENTKEIRIVWLGVIIILFTILILFLIIITKRYKIKKANSKERFLLYYKYIIILINHSSIKKSPYETLAQYIYRYVENIKGNTTDIIKLTQIYESIYYSNKEVENNELDKIIMYYKSLKKKAWREGNKLKFTWLFIRVKII